MKGLFGYEVKEKQKRKTYTRPPYINPMVTAFGPHPLAGQKCSGCIHLYYKQYSKKYYKCELRGDTGGPGTDHKKFYPACSKYQKK